MLSKLYLIHYLIGNKLNSNKLFINYTLINNNHLNNLEKFK